MLIKFFLNKILLEKVQNECKKPSFLHKDTCTGKQKCGVAFLNSQFFTLGGFGLTCSSDSTIERNV